jgi:hypothetical protein
MNLKVCSGLMHGLSKMSNQQEIARILAIILRLLINCMYIYHDFLFYLIYSLGLMT